MKKVLIGILVALILVVGNVYNHQLGFAGNLYPLNGNEVLLSDYSDDQKREFLIKIDENGYFCKEVIQGDGRGSFEAWDGEKFYRYDKEYDDLLIVNNPKDGSKVIAHPFLSEVITERIIEDISKSKLKRNFLSNEYKKIEKNEQEIVESIIFDDQNKYPQKYQMKVDDEEVFVYEIKNLKELTEELNVSETINLKQLRENHVKITEIKEDELGLK